MTTLRSDIVSWIDDRVRAIASTPRMWGTPEAVEMQVLQLLQVRDVVANPVRGRSEPRRVLDAYNAFLQHKFPNRRSPASELLTDPDELGRLLNEFWLRVRPSFTAENPFENHEVAFRFTFAPHLNPSAAAVMGYVEEVRRSARALARPEAGSRRAPRPIEVATDFALDDLQLVPKNGAPAQAVVCLGRSDEAEASAERDVRDAFSKLVAMAEWAQSPEDVATGAASNTPDRTRVAMQARRLIPGRGIDRVEIGGRLMARSRPVVVEPSLERRFLSVISADAEQEPFDKTDEIRAIDLDRGLVKLGRARINCSVSSELLREVGEVGVAARIRGTLFTPPTGGPKFVVVETIEVQDEPGA